jgi:hypothetical protein
MHPVLALVALDARLQGPLPALRALSDELAPDLRNAGTLAAGVETSDSSTKLLVHLVAPVLGKILSPSPLTRDQGLKACLGLSVDISLGRGISRSIETIPAPKGSDADASLLSQLLCCRTSDSIAVCLEGLGLKGLEFEDYLEANLSLSDALLAIDSTKLSEGLCSLG